MAEVKPPVLKGLEVTQALYETAWVLITLEQLKEIGVVTGGPVVDRDQLTAIELAGRGFGYSPPSVGRVQEIMEDIMNLPYAEEEDDEEETEVQD